MSCRKFSARSDVRTYRQQFAETWRDFIQANFESAAEVALVFRVNTSTAENWWTGANAPQGWVVARVVADPEMHDAALAAFGGR